MSARESLHITRKTAFMATAIVFGLFLSMTHFMSHAVQEMQQFDQPEQRLIYQRLLDELRCVVCQNQNLADSNAHLANDFKQLIADKIRQGQTQQEIVDFMVARYGQFVLYKPPVMPNTWVLWFGPFILLIITAAIIYRWQRSAPKRATTEDGDLRSARQLLEHED